MTRSYDYFGEDLEREHLKDEIYLAEEKYLEELEWEESVKRRNFEIREPRKPNSKYGRAKIIRKTNSIRKVCKTCKYKSAKLQRDDRNEPLY
jgi:hypothetical protein